MVDGSGLIFKIDNDGYEDYLDVSGKLVVDVSIGMGIKGLKERFNGDLEEFKKKCLKEMIDRDIDIYIKEMVLIDFFDSLLE